MTRNGVSLVLSSAVVIAGVAIGSALPGADYLRLLLGVPIVALLPGWAVVVAIDPHERFGGLERLAIAIGLSLSVTVAMGLVLAVRPGGIDAGGWMLALGGLVLILNTIAARTAHRAGGSRAAGPLHRSPVAFAIAGVAVLSLAVVAVSDSGPVPPPSGAILQLWAMPAPEKAPGTIQVGIANLVSPTGTFDLRVTQGGRVLSERTIAVPQGTSTVMYVRKSSEATPGQAIEAVLTTFGDPGLVRRVRVWAQ